MSSFDTIVCKMKLPEDAPDFVKKNPVFQTYDLGCRMDDYIITEEGELVVRPLALQILSKSFGKQLLDLLAPVNYKRKRIEMYTTNLRGGSPTKDGKYVYYTDGGVDLVDITYVVQIRSGKVSSIKEKFRKVRPAVDWAERT